MHNPIVNRIEIFFYCEFNLIESFWICKKIILESNRKPMNCESDRFAVYPKIHSPSNDWNVAGQRSGWTQLRLASVTCSLLNWSHCQRSSRAAVLLQTSPHTDLERLDSVENMADRITKLTGPYENKSAYVLFTYRTLKMHELLYLKKKS